MGHTLDGGADPGRVHEGEHGLQPLVGLIQHGANGAVKVQHRGGVGADAHLVFEGAGVDAIALTNRAVGRNLEFGHHKQRDAARAFGCAGQACQYDVHNVLGQIVVT